jgi:D-arabinan exo alpha-(1,3)/(1,5)-arabinofuranosidase (non-reducing end)
MFLRVGAALTASILLLHAVEPPVIPVGLDAYRQWEKWPCLRVGARAYMRSTYDRRGGNEGADASHFLYQLAEDRNVTLDLESPGILYFARFNHWHGSPWHFEVDGVDHVVQETSTADPNHPAPNSIFLPRASLPNPLTWTWSETRGADLSWAPIPFERSFRLAYSRTHYGTGYYIYHQFVPGVKLSRSIKGWNDRDAPTQDVLDLINRSGSDLLPASDSREARRAGLRQYEGAASLIPGRPCALAEMKPGPSMLRSLQFTIPRDQAIEFGRARLRITWDDLPRASVDAPIALFYGAGTLYNRDDHEYLVKAFPVTIRFDAANCYLSCFFPMPFFRSARLELENAPENTNNLSVRWSARCQPLREHPEQVAHFHASYRDHKEPVPGLDLTLLDTRVAEGGGEWSGHLVGTSWTFSDRAALNTLEGDPRFFFDDSQTPQAQGTGTEEWGGGGDYWGGLNMTLPFAGHPTGARNPNEAKCEEDKIESAYRFLLADLMPFGKNALIRLEHGGQNESAEHYQTVTYWYGKHAATLVKSDELKIGDRDAEAAHRYVSTRASEPYEIVSRYEWGVDTLNGKEVYPAERDLGRKTTGASEFDLKLVSENYGVLLRRKLDYQFANQRAEIFIAPVEAGKVTGRFRKAGVWYLAGGSTCIYSNPKDELGPAQHIVQTSNRRFRDDEFLVPLNLTRGRDEIRVRVTFTPLLRPLFPGRPPEETAWTELRYDAYCFVMPGEREANRKNK